MRAPPARGCHLGELIRWRRTDAGTANSAQTLSCQGLRSAGRRGDADRCAAPGGGRGLAAAAGDAADILRVRFDDRFRRPGSTVVYSVTVASAATVAINDIVT